MHHFYLLLCALVYAAMHVSNAGKLHIVESLENHSIPLFISHDPSMNHTVKLNTCINNVNELQLYRKPRVISKSIALNTSVTLVEDELFYKPELEGLWQTQILSTTQVVFFLGQLLIASSAGGFSLQDSSSNIPYKYIRYPSSSQTTMLQIANEAYNAFDQAHHNMDSIQVSMRSMPFFIRKALTIIWHGSPNAIKRLLPETIGQIQSKCENARKAATKTDSKFSDVMLLIGEVVEASGLAKHLSEEKLRELERELAITRKMLDKSLKMKKRIRKHFKETRSKMKKAKERYVNALKKIPIGYQALFQNFTRDILGAVVDVFTTNLNVPLFGPAAGLGSLLLSEKEGNQTRFSRTKTAKPSIIWGKLFAEKIAELIPTVDKVFSKCGNKSAKSADEFETYKKGFEFLRSNMETSKSNSTMHRITGFVEEGIELTGKAVHLIKEVTSLFGNKQQKENSQQSPAQSSQEQENAQQSEAAENLKEQFHQLNNKAQPYAVANSLVTGESSKNLFSNDHSPTGNAKYLGAIALERLRDCEQRYDQRFEDFKQAQMQWSQLMIKIAALNFTKIDRHEIINVSCEIFRILGDLREQWSRLSLVLGHLEYLTSNELSDVEAFGSQTLEMIEHPSSLEIDGSLFKELFRKQIIAVHKSTYLVFLISRTYVDASQRYVVSQVAGLTKFSAARTNEERNQLKDQLFRTAQSALNEIRSLVDERKRQYHTVIEQRRMELDAFMENLGGLTSDEQALIEEGKRLEGA